tara:strand:- start:489 stop:800 length:312 start_codon:yes stop_codon:yes gene_type:complete
MQNISLHFIKSRTTLLKYALVVSLLLSIGLSVFSAWHNSSHLLQADQHCALCLNAHNVDHSLPTYFPPFFAPLFAEPIVILGADDGIKVVVSTTGNRDPPYII